MCIYPDEFERTKRKQQQKWDAMYNYKLKIRSKNSQLVKTYFSKGDNLSGIIRLLNVGDTLISATRLKATNCV